MAKHLKPLLLLFTSMLSACGLNGVNLLPQGGKPSNDSAVVIYGLRIAGKQSSFPMSLDAYDVKKGVADGNCFRWNRMQARLSHSSSSTQYFAFNVNPGHYVYGVHHLPLRGDLLAFEAKAGQTFFIGEFVLTPENDVVLARNLTLAKQRIFSALPKTEQEVALAPTEVVQDIRLFLCTP